MDWPPGTGDLPRGGQPGRSGSMNDCSRIASPAAEPVPPDLVRAVVDERSMIRLAGGEFTMGSDRHHPEERPAHPASVGGFRIDETPVTNRQFAEFVEATGYETFAEI